MIDMTNRERAVLKAAKTYLRASKHRRQLEWLHDEHEMRDAINPEVGVCYIDGTQIVRATPRRDRVLRKLMPLKFAVPLLLRRVHKLDPHGDVRELLLLHSMLPARRELFHDLSPDRGDNKLQRGRR